MKSILTKKVLFLALVAVTVFATGCIKEDLDECYKLTLKVVNHKGDDITALTIVPILMFLQDMFGIFLF